MDLLTSQVALASSPLEISLGHLLDSSRHPNKSFFQAFPMTHQDGSALFFIVRLPFASGPPLSSLTRSELPFLFGYPHAFLRRRTLTS